MDKIRNKKQGSKDSVTILLKHKGSEELVRPQGLLLAIQRQLRRREALMRKAQAMRDGDNIIADTTVRPLIVPKPVRDALSEVADQLLQSYSKYEKNFPGGTLAKWLDKRAGEILKDAWQRGKPIAKEDIMRALAEMYAYAQRERGNTRPVVISGGNRKERRAIKKKTKGEVIKV